MAMLLKQPQSRPTADSVVEVLSTIGRELNAQPAGREHPSSGQMRVPAPKTVAVLPFANFTGAAEDEAFGDGLAEEIINVLTQNSGLNLIARTSAFAFKGLNEDIRKIGNALGAGFVVEGSIRRAGVRVRVTVQLIRASDGLIGFAIKYPSLSYAVIDQNASTGGRLDFSKCMR
jgi:TolB-like protein